MTVALNQHNRSWSGPTVTVTTMRQQNVHLNVSTLHPQPELILSRPHCTLSASSGSSAAAARAPPRRPHPVTQAEALTLREHKATTHPPTYSSTHAAAHHSMPATLVPSIRCCERPLHYNHCSRPRHSPAHIALATECWGGPTHNT